MTQAKPDALTLLAFIGVVVFLGSNFVAVRFSNDELPPFWGATIRFAVASILLLAMTRMRGIALPRTRALLGAVLFGALAFGLNFGLLYWGLVELPSGLASVVFATIPLSTFVAAVLLRIERFRWAGLAGALIVVGGILAISFEALTGDVRTAPLIAIITASLAAAMSGIVIKAFPKSHPLAVNAVAMPIGAVLLLGASLAFGEPRIIPQNPATWWAVAWLILSSIVAFSLMVWVIGRWTASANAFGSVLAPLVTIPLAATLRGEAIELPFVAAAILVVWGVYVGALYRGRSPSPTGKPTAA